MLISLSRIGIYSWSQTFGAKVWWWWWWWWLDFCFYFWEKYTKKKKNPIWFSNKTRNPLKVLSVTLNPFLVVCSMCKPLIVLHITPLRFLSVTQNSHDIVLCENVTLNFLIKQNYRGGLGRVKCDTMNSLHTKQYHRGAKC